MSEAIDAMRSHFNQVPIPKAKFLLDERDRVNAMIDAIETENNKLRELSSIMLKCIKAKESRFIVCWECPMHEQFDELRSYCCLEHEAKELGIEVPE